MDSFQRDFGRVEANLETLKEDTKTLKTDVAEIKKLLNAQTAVKDSDWKRLGLVGVFFTVVNQVVTAIRYMP